MSLVREAYIDQGLHTQTIDILMQSWRPETQKQYSVYLRQWQQYCVTRSINCVRPTVSQALTFMAKLHSERNLGYSAMNSVRCALSAVFAIQDIAFGSLPIVKRFVKGIFEKKPSFPCYAEIWDAGNMIDHLKHMPV